MQDHIGLDDLLQRGAESGDELCREIGNETDRIGEHDLAAMRKRDRAHGGIECRKQQILGNHTCLGQGTEQRRFAGIGVANEGHDRIGNSRPALAMQAARLDDGSKLLLESRDAFLDKAPVGFELSFAGAAEEAETAALPLEVSPGSDQTALLVPQMSELDLQKALAGSCASAKYFQDQAGAIEDLGLPGIYEIALLDGAQRSVDNDED